MDFVPDPPTFAVEVRNNGDYGHTAERSMDEKRADYFEAGTAVVWDVDPIAGIITKHTANDLPVTFHAGETADAEPAVPGWRVLADEIFDV